MTPPTPPPFEVTLPPCFSHFLQKHFVFTESRPLAEHCTCDTLFQWQTQPCDSPHAASTLAVALTFDLKG